MRGCPFSSSLCFVCEYKISRPTESSATPSSEARRLDGHFGFSYGATRLLNGGFPKKYRHLAPKDYVPGGRSDRLLNTRDLAPTMLSLSGIKPPEFHQGQAFAGPFEAAPRACNFGFRGRMDERYDLMCSVRDKRYMYLGAPETAPTAAAPACAARGFINAGCATRIWACAIRF